MEYYRQSGEAAMQTLQTNRDGLSQTEAEKRQARYGKNKLEEGKRKGVMQVFIEQFKDLLVFILIAAGVISMFSGQMESTLVIFAVLILNAVLGTVQYFKAEKSLDSLKELSAPSARVLRDGKQVQIPSEDLVPGDILILEAGDLVTADARIIQNFSIKVNESSLTGESEPVEKKEGVIEKENVPLGDRINMVFSGSLVTYGRAVAVVTETGMQTQLGKIAGLMNQTAQRKTSLQVSLDQFSQRLAILIMAVCLVVFGLSLYRRMEILDALLFAVALAVAAIPEAMGSIVTIVLAMGTQKMAKENAVIKQLKSVESLGSVSVICSDKTGTLTQNCMTVQKLYDGEKCFTAKELDLLHPAQYMLMKEAVLVNDAHITADGEIGDPTETALLRMAEEWGIDTAEYRKLHPRIAEIAFDSDRKLMSTLHKMDSENVLCTKGAVDVLLPRAAHILTPGGRVPMTKEQKEAILKTNRELSDQGLRVLCFAIRKMGDTQALTVSDETDYTFVGLISMMDPPREEAKIAVADAKMGGVKTVMITGDHKVTASAIAKQLGILEPGTLAVDGSELDAMSEEEFSEKIEKIRVYARVSPEHKIRIVNMWQKKGKIAAMTGDGVNDAPALKQADIGIAMGKVGTEVAKDAADMILTDDNFATIVKAIVYGRNIYENIRNAILYLLSGNTAGILCVLMTSILGMPVPFFPVHLLFINLLTDSLPAIAIGMEPAGKGLLHRPPRDPKASFLNKETMIRILLQGVLIGACTMGAYFKGLEVSAALASTMAFATLTLARLLHGFNCRADASIVRLRLRSNPYSIAAFFAGAVLLAAVLLIPGLETLFSVAAMNTIQLGWIVLLAVIPTLLIQGWKMICERKN